MSYSFRIRLKLPHNMAIGIDSDKLLLTTADTKPAVTLRSRERGVLIKDSRELILRGEGYKSENKARSASERYQDALALACARVRIGADFGNLSGKGGITKYGRQMLEQQLRKRVLYDFHGLSVFETEPLPLFIRLEAKLKVARGRAKFEKALSIAVEKNLKLSEQERLSFDLFSASFFQPSSDARFLMLMMAIETLLEPALRPDMAKQHVDELIKFTKDSTTLSTSEKNSILGSLRWLYNDSIGQTGRKLAQKLKGHRYMDREPENFFTHCYNIRSQLIHGNTKRPTHEKVNVIAATLESFVGDLLCGPLLEMVTF